MEAQEAGSSDPDGNEDFVVALIAAGKRCGYSFDEMGELRVRDLLALIEVHVGGKKGRPRLATQADIDRLLA